MACNKEQKMTDLIERLRNGAVNEFADYGNLCDDAADELERLQKVEWSRLDGDSYYEGHIGDLERRIEELEAMPKYHHPDCNWWKWDWRYSWDTTDCNCDAVAGPTEKED